MTQRFGVWRNALRLLAEAGKGLAVLVAALTLAEAILGLTILWLIKALVETLNIQGMDTHIAWQIGLIVGTIILLGMVGVWANYLRIRQGLEVSKVVDHHIHAKAISINYGFYESPVYFDSLERARQAGSQRPTQLINNALLLLKSLAFLIGTAIILTTLNWRILPALFVSIVAILMVRLMFTRSLFNWKKSRAQMERRASYIDLLITTEWHAKEVRLGDMGESLQAQYRDIRNQINTEQLAIERRKSWAELAVSLLGAAMFAGSTLLLLFDSTNGTETVGNLVLFLLLFRRAETSGRETVQSLSKLYDDRLFLQQIFEFLRLETLAARPASLAPLPDPIIEGLRFESVTFAYPNNPKPVLTNINLEIPTGKTIALVGENGSGKTTLIKVLARLYDPDNGQVTLDGIDIKRFDPEAYRRRFSVVFQTFANYAATLRQNVSAGDMTRAEDDAGIMDALERAGAVTIATSLPQGLDTPLSKVFEGGHELSGGQWQRLALARAFFRRSDFLVLDEPSSALDPRAEFELFEDLRERADGRGILLISHRLSTVRMADYIYVLDNGHLIEEGTHDTLANADGRYAELFEIQAHKYR